MEDRVVREVVSDDLPVDVLVGGEADHNEDRDERDHDRRDPASWVPGRDGPDSLAPFFVTPELRVHLELGSSVYLGRGECPCAGSPLVEDPLVCPVGYELLQRVEDRFRERPAAGCGTCGPRDRDPVWRGREVVARYLDLSIRQLHLIRGDLRVCKRGNSAAADDCEV